MRKGGFTKKASYAVSTVSSEIQSSSELLRHRVGLPNSGSSGPWLTSPTRVVIVGGGGSEATTNSPKLTAVNRPMRQPGKVHKTADVGESSRSRARKKPRPGRIGKGLRKLYCVGGAGSRSRTPERRIGLRVVPVHVGGGNKENHMFSSLRRKARRSISGLQDAVHNNKKHSDRDSKGESLESVSTAGSDVPELYSMIRTSYYGESNNNNNTSKIGIRGGVSNCKTLTANRPANINGVTMRRPPNPSQTPPAESGITLIKTLRLHRFMQNLWISGIAVTKKGEIVVVDLREAHLLDSEGNLKKTIGLKGPSSLMEPIDVCVMASGNLAFSDHADHEIKIYNSKGQFLRNVKNQFLANIAGVATNDRREIFIAGTDRQCVTVHSEEDKLLYTIPQRGSEGKPPFDHPYSIAVNPLSGGIIVGDDYRQMVTAVSCEGRVLWRFCPSGERHFFPSSICVDDTGYIFIADLYNEKVYMLDSSGKYLKTILSRGDGLKGGPGAIATDGLGHLYVADEEKTLKVFKYGEKGFALYRRFSSCPSRS